jgi:phosphoglycolate phosphatase-like HAD superfamily hydrolase
MTLVDSSEAILKSALATLKEFDPTNNISESEIRSSVGLPMKDSLREWLGDQNSGNAFQYYKEFYIREGLHSSFAMPGAISLLKNLTKMKMNFCIITAKDPLVAETQLSFLGFPKSIIFGNRFREQKTAAMKEFGCDTYVGDHVEDYEAAARAGADFIGVEFNISHDLSGLVPPGTLIVSRLSEVSDYLLKSK